MMTAENRIGPDPRLNSRLVCFKKIIGVLSLPWLYMKHEVTMPCWTGYHAVFSCGYIYKHGGDV